MTNTVRIKCSVGPNRINADLVEADVMQKDIAETCGRSRYTVRNVILGVSDNPEVREAIAAATGRKVADYWWTEERTRRGRPRKQVA